MNEKAGFGTGGFDTGGFSKGDIGHSAGGQGGAHYAGGQKPNSHDGQPLDGTLFEGPMASAMREYQRQRQMTLGDLLLENRVIFLQGEIYDGNANELVMKLLYLQSENRRKDIHFYINSPGGSVTSTLAIYDTMQMISPSVATYCVGLAASGGAVLLAGGAAKKRFALKHAKVMIHQPHGGVGGQVSDIEIQANEMVRTRQLLNEILASHTGKTVEEIGKACDRDYYMTAAEAKEYGVVDDILIKQPSGDEEDD
ncbi:MAG: ATP-dependent Clp protease proteolytic subunit [Pirellulales bacterium]|nr:ATP-dependent Clp protease proteolytic subunit [Pirellulales bacterium]